MREVTESPLDPPSADDAASGFILPLRAIPIDEFEELAGNPMAESGSSAVIGNGDGVVPIPAIPIAGPKFCRQCGATRDAETDECGHCARRTLSRQAPVALDEPASGSVTSALALFPLETILVSAMMFMTLHLSPMRFPHTLAMGMAAGYLRTHIHHHHGIRRGSDRRFQSFAGRGLRRAEQRCIPDGRLDRP